MWPFLGQSKGSLQFGIWEEGAPQAPVDRVVAVLQSLSHV